MKTRLTLDGMTQLENSLEALGKRGKVGGELAMGAAMAEAEAQAKLTAPWTDRTGNARNSIGGYSPVEGGQGKVVGVLSIGMFYGVFLELSNGGKYRIVWPTLEWEGARLPLWLSRFLLSDI